MIQTDHLELRLRSPEDLRAAIDAMSPTDRKELSAEWLAQARAATQADPWVHGFAAVHRESGLIIGQGAYKGPPADGVVEIAYAVEPDQRRKGYATQIAKALVSFAFRFKEVQVVRAHTLRELNESSRLLAKCGFEHLGEVLEPDDGWVWRFEMRRPQS
jgi:[ribosomal protein S5]-alanine N-acetyltransferase